MITYNVYYFDPTDIAVDAWEEGQALVRWATFNHQMQADECMDRLQACGLTALCFDEQQPTKRTRPRLVWDVDGTRGIEG